MLPKTSQQYQQIREKRKEKIFQAGLWLFARQGYAHTTISQIARESDMSKGLFYNYFEDKEGLLQEIIDRAINETEKIMAPVKKPAQPAQRLEQLFDAFFTSIEQNASQWKLIVSLGLQVEQFGHFRETIVKSLFGYIRLVEILLKDLNYPRPNEEAWLIGAILDEISLDFLLGGNEYPLKNIVIIIKNN